MIPGSVRPNGLLWDHAVDGGGVVAVPDPNFMSALAVKYTILIM